MAIDFINKSFEFCDVVAFILPNIFIRYFTQKKIVNNAGLIHQSPIEKNSFTYKDKVQDINCVFQIWVKKESKFFDEKKDIRQYFPPKNTHDDFKLKIHNNTKETKKYFNKEEFNWDFAVHRQGYYNYKTIFTESKGMKENRQYLFIKFINNKDNIENKEIIKNMEWERIIKRNTLVPGFSNADFVEEYIRIKNEKENN